MSLCCSVEHVSRLDKETEHANVQTCIHTYMPDAHACVHACFDACQSVSSPPQLLLGLSRGVIPASPLALPTQPCGLARIPWRCRDSRFLYCKDRMHTTLELQRLRNRPQGGRALLGPAPGGQALLDMLNHRWNTASESSAPGPHRSIVRVCVLLVGLFNALLLC